MFSRLGDQFTVIALIWFTLELTGSGVAVGAVILCFQLPKLISGPLAGILLDRYQPRFILAIDNFARTLSIAAIPGIYWLGTLHMWHVYALVLAAGTFSPATEVGVRVLIPELVPDHEIEGANALWSMSWEYAMILGPAAAGFLVESVGGPMVLLIDAGSFLLMGTLVCFLPNLIRDQKEADGSAGGLAGRFGFGPLVRMKKVFIITMLTTVFFFAYGPLEVGLPAYSREVLQAGASGYGLMWSAFGIGSVLGLLSIGRFSNLPRPGMLLAAIALLWGVLLLPLLIIENLPLAMVCLFVAGFAWSPYNVTDTSLTQRLVPQHLRGRIFGIRAMLNVGSAPLGAAVGGILLDYLSVLAVIGASALTCMIIGAVGFLSPTLRGIRRGEEHLSQDEANQDSLREPLVEGQDSR